MGVAFAQRPPGRLERRANPGLTLNNAWDVTDIKLSRLDTKSGIARSLSKGAPDHVMGWVVDRQGLPVVATAWHQGRFRAYTKPHAAPDWLKWQDAEGFGGSRPLLMAYGGADRRVPIKHGTEFRDAVRRTNKAVEWVEYPDEGHGWQKLETNIDFWTRVEKFLERNIGPEAK